MGRGRGLVVCGAAAKGDLSPSVPLRRVCALLLQYTNTALIQGMFDRLYDKDVGAGICDDARREETVPSSTANSSPNGGLLPVDSSWQSVDEPMSPSSSFYSDNLQRLIFDGTPGSSATLRSVRLAIKGKPQAEGIKLQWKTEDALSLFFGVHTEALSKLAPDGHRRLSEDLENAANSGVSISWLLNCLHLNRLIRDYSRSCSQHEILLQRAKVRFHQQSTETVHESCSGLLSLFEDALARTGAIRRFLGRHTLPTHINNLQSDYNTATASVAEGEMMTDSDFSQHMAEIYRSWCSHLQNLRRSVIWRSVADRPLMTQYRAVKKYLKVLADSDIAIEDRAKALNMLDIVCGAIQALVVKLGAVEANASTGSYSRLESAAPKIWSVDGGLCSWPERVKAFIYSTITLATHQVTVHKVDDGVFELSTFPADLSPFKIPDSRVTAQVALLARINAVKDKIAQVYPDQGVYQVFGPTWPLNDEKKVITTRTAIEDLLRVCYPHNFKHE